MFNINTAQEGDKVLVSIKGKEVTATINKIRPHSINWNKYVIFVTTDYPVEVWNKEDVRTNFCITFDTSGNEGITKILA